MFHSTRYFGLALVLTAGLAAPVLAQTATQPATPDTTAPATQPAEAPAAPDAIAANRDAATVNQAYVKSSHGDWELRCIKTQDGGDPCQLYQLLKDDKGNSVAEISMIALPDGGQALAGATVVVPLETLLPPQLTIAIGTNAAKHYPYAYCNQIGCYARVGLTSDEVATMKSGKSAAVSVVPVAAPDKVVTVQMSLKGFTDGFDALKAASQPVKK